MKFLYNTLRMAVRALRRNILHSALTTLGIVIGIASVIAMMEVGQGSSTAIRRTIESIGANILLVQPGTLFSNGVRYGNGSVMTLTPDDAEAIERECPDVDYVAPYVWARSQIVYGNQNWVPLYMYGTTPSYLTVRDWDDLDQGRCFTDKDVHAGARVCVIGQTLVRELFDGQSPIDKDLRIQNVSFRVIGVLRSKGANMMGYDQDDILLAPWTAIKKRVSDNLVDPDELHDRGQQSARPGREDQQSQSAVSDLQLSAGSLSAGGAGSAGGHAAIDAPAQCRSHPCAGPGHRRHAGSDAGNHTTLA